MNTPPLQAFVPDADNGDDGTNTDQACTVALTERARSRKTVARLRPPLRLRDADAVDPEVAATLSGATLPAWLPPVPRAAVPPPRDPVPLVAVLSVDCRHRVYLTDAVHALGWGPTRRLRVDDLADRVVLAEADQTRPQRAVTVDGEGRIVLPVAPRRRLNLRPGSRIVTLACTTTRTVTLVPAATAATVLVAR